jgi:signal transduction histidine kinase
VLCDRDRIVQVLVGLVDNAVKHAGERQTVTVRARVEGRDVVVQVSDTGPGISADEIPLVFDRFYTAKGKQRHSGRGAGLGLSIAKEIVEAHDSRLSVTSAPGEGTTFSFALQAVGGCSD